MYLVKIATEYFALSGNQDGVDRRLRAFSMSSVLFQTVYGRT